MWHGELKKRVRKPTDLDDLWRAACEETNGAQARSQGFTDASQRHFKESIRLLQLYLKKKRSDQRDRDNGFERL